MLQNKRNKGFTLVELIIVVAIIGLLAAALFVAVDPARRIGEARDAQRFSDVTAVLNAVLTYTVDETTLPTQVSALTAGSQYAIPTHPTLTTGNYTCGAVNTGAAISSYAIGASIAPTYIATLPIDPSITPSGAVYTGYFIEKSSAGRVKIGACNESSYATASIQVQR